MSLRRRTILTVSTALVALLVAVDLVSRHVWIRGFLALEQNMIRAQVTRCLNDLEGEAKSLDRQATDWSDWDDLYEFVDNPTEQFIESNILPSVFENLHLNLIIVLDRTGKLVYGTAYDLRTRSVVPLTERVREVFGVAPHQPRFTDMRPHRGVLVADSPMLVSIRPILDSKSKLPPRGTFIMGRQVGSRRVAATGDRVQFHPWPSDALPPEVAEARSLISAGTPRPVRVHDEFHVDGFACVRDLNNAPVLLMAARMNRDVYRQGQITRSNLMLAVAIVCTVFAVLTLLLIEHFAIGRIHDLSESIRRATAGGELSRGVEATGSDEIHSLACDLNQLLESVVTSREQARQSRRVLETLLSNLPGMAYRCRNNRDWPMEFVSEGCEALTGFPARHLVNNRKLAFGSLIHPEDVEMVWDSVQGALEQREPFKAVYRIRTASGQTKWVWEQGRGVFSDGGELLSIEGFIADMSDQKRVEEELERARDQAEVANKFKSAFLANMSHEIRTPMTAILGYADELLTAQPLEPELTEGLSIIRRNGGHLLEVINDILDLSKIEAGKMIIENVGCSPIAILMSIESLMRARAREKRLDFTLEYATPLPQQIRSDPTRLRQILINLVGNAVKFTERGEVRVVAALVDHPGPGSRLQIDVIDTGIGMDAEQIGSLFRPFMQGDASTTRRFGGTGLGLSISHRLAEKLGGSIEVLQSRPGRGSTFRFALSVGTLEGVPLCEPTLEGACPADLPAPRSPAGPPAVSGRLLLAEDGPDNRKLISRMLQRAGMQVVCVEDGLQALDRALEAERAGQPFELILMDMQMPVMDGYEAVKRLRREGYARPIVALTAHAMSSDRDKCLGCGCDEYQTKPINRASLLSLIDRLLRTSREAAEAGTAGR